MYSPAALRRLSGGSPAALRRLSGGSPAALRRLSGGSPAALREPHADRRPSNDEWFRTKPILWSRRGQGEATDCSWAGTRRSRIRDRRGGCERLLAVSDKPTNRTRFRPAGRQDFGSSFGGNAASLRSRRD